MSHEWALQRTTIHLDDAAVSQVSHVLLVLHHAILGSHVGALVGKYWKTIPDCNLRANSHFPAQGLLSQALAVWEPQSAKPPLSLGG